MKKMGAKFLILKEKDIQKVLNEYLRMYDNFKNIKINIEHSKMGGFDVMFELEF